ncbi:MAG: peptidase D-alanyl-D-alanine carboxypeptidase 1 [Pseudonocardiales bacterium]|nr:peptidase D-alanyl-D-alanine carboxypeptidase 1 [Pseudonocardiales bacterium]
MNNVSYWTSIRHDRRTRRPVALSIGALLILGLIAVIVAAVVCLASAQLAGRASPARPGLRVDWPPAGQAAVASTETGVIGTSGPHQPAPIASVAKVMTAYLVLEKYPLSAGRNGFLLPATDDDVRDTDRRRAQGESVVSLQSGQVLTERDALLALLLPSANNVASMLATAVAGSESTFVSLMNARARALGMDDTTYTDPSGAEASTVSTAEDQLRMARAAMKIPVFAAMVGQRSARVAGIGVLANVDTLLGRDGFVGIKTGSHDAAGGCFMFESRFSAGGRAVSVIGVVLGQPDLAGALASAQRMVNSLRPQLGAK